VNAGALACLPEAIADQSYIDQYVSEVLEGRERLCSALIDNGVEFWPSEANFVLMRAGSSPAEAAWFVEETRRRGILVRDRSNDEGCEGCVRITLGSRAHTDRLLAALQEVLQELRVSQEALRS
jgi:histidinol-phosphate aminotransferase